jgi:hypothetical protein
MDESRIITKSVAARILVILAPLAYLLFYILQGKLLLLGNTDHVDAQLPSLFAARNALVAGQWPWWNPYIFNGTPLWGSTGLFLWYPLTWIELLAPRTITLHVSTLLAWLQYFGVFAASFLYFRILIGDERWASFSALAYGFSMPVAYGLAVGNALLPVYLFLPLSLYFLHSHQQRSLQKNIIYLTISLYCLLTGGFLQLLIYAMAILGSYLLFLSIQSNSRRQAFSLIGMFALSLLFAMLLSTPAWLSTLYMARLVSRVSAANGVLESIMHGGYATPPNLWLRLILPDAFGFGMWVPPVNYVETMVSFCGVGSLFLAGAATLNGPKKVTYYWAVFIILILLLISSKLLIIQYFAFGGVEVMYGRLAFLLPLGFASLAGLGGKSLSETRISRWKMLLFNPLNIFLVVVFYLNKEIITQIFINIISMLREFYTHQTLLITDSNLAELEFIRAATIIFVFVLTFAFFNMQKNYAFWVIAVALLFLEVIPGTYLMHEVQVNSLMISPTSPFFAFDKVGTPLPFSTSDLAQFRFTIREEISSRRENESPAFANVANQGSIYGYQSPWGYANAYSSNLATLIQTVGVIDLNPDCKSEGMIYADKDIFYNATRQVAFDPLCHPRLADLMSVGAVIKAETEWRIAADRRANALPRATLFYDYEIIPDSVDASNRLAEHDFNIHKTLVIEKRPELDTGPTDPAARSFLIKSTSNVVIIEVHSNTPVLLLLTDTYGPGWMAKVDDQPSEIIRANVAFRSVWVPSGEHVVTFQYDPPLLTFSLLIEIIGIIGFVAVVSSSKWRTSKGFLKGPLVE